MTQRTGYPIIDDILDSVAPKGERTTNMMTYELDDIEKQVLMNKVVERARADLNDGQPLTEMRQETQCADCFAWVKRDDPHTCKRQVQRNQQKENASRAS